MKRIPLMILASLCAAQAQQKPQVSLWVARDAATGPRVRLVLNTRNLPRVHMAAWRVDPLPVLLTRDRAANRPPDSGPPVRQWDVTLPARPAPGQQDVYRSRQVNLPPLSPGVYLLVGSGGEREAWAVVNVTSLAVVVKRSPSRLLAWVTRADTGATVRGAAVRLYTRAGRIAAEGRTDASGVAVFAAPPGDHVLVASSGADLAAAPSSGYNPDGALRAHLQTDRPVYQPGQTVQWKAILRRTEGRGYEPVSGTECQVEVRDPKDNPLQRETLRSTAAGTISGRIELPAEAMLGAYSLVIEAGKDRAYATFAVAEYRKPEYRATVTPAAARYLAGDAIPFHVQAGYYFGAPVPQAEVRYTVRRTPAPFGEPSDSAAWDSGGDGNLYPRDTYGYAPVIATGVVYTDEKGLATIDAKSDPKAPDSTYAVSCTVTDAARRQVEASGSVPVYASTLRVALKTDVMVAPLGSLFPVSVRLVDLDGRPAAGKVVLALQQDVWIEKEGRYRRNELTRTSVTVGRDGRGSARLPARAAGSLTVHAEAVDRTGRAAVADLGIFVAGPNEAPQRETGYPELTLKRDRATYRPGQTAKVWVSSSTKGRPVLLTVEGADLFAWKVVPAGSSGALWSVPLTLAMAPNATATALQWVKGQAISGSVPLPVPDTSRRLKVTVSPDRADATPGETARYTVRTTGGDGRPVPAEVALSVVDEAVYAVRPDTTPDLYTFFWGPRASLVSTTWTAPEEVSGGAYQRVSEMAPVRERFLDTAYWDAHVTTDATGVATVDVPLPGNLTTWRATARAVTADTRVGIATAALRSSRPVTLRLATPRQMVRGDRLTLIGTVNDRTDRDRDFETAISVQGLALEEPNTRTVHVPAGGEGTVEWTIRADALPEDGAALVTGRTLATDAGQDATALSDALRVPVKIAPAGIPERIVSGATLESERTLELELPSDRLEPASEVTIFVRAGLTAARDEAARRVLASPPYGSPGAADRLAMAGLVPGVDPAVVRDAVALAARYQRPDGGWGCWDQDPEDPALTARVLTALVRARSAGLAVPDSLLRLGVAGAERQFGNTSLWEHRALLAAAVGLASHEPGRPLLDEVARRAGDTLSPFARLLMAEALAADGRTDAAAAEQSAGLAGIVAGPDAAYVPAGDRPGWTATTAETTAQALISLTALGRADGVAARLAQWLARPESFRSTDEDALTAVALTRFIAVHPDPAGLGDLAATFNGQPVEPEALPFQNAVRISVPRALLRDENGILLQRTGEGTAFATVEARVYRPAPDETAEGIRVLRRFDTQDASGLWVEANRRIRPAAPVRATVVVWPDDRTDAIRVTEPLPAGFEVTDTEITWGTREEVRGGAVIHDVRPAGQPITFRYYLRAESEGTVLALPAQAEVLRRPAVRGHSAPATLEVGK